jgi:hypothetical protein
MRFAVLPDVALHSGVYSFTLNPAEGETKLVQVRLTVSDLIAPLIVWRNHLLHGVSTQAFTTLLYRKCSGCWLIAKEHVYNLSKLPASHCIVYCTCHVTCTLCSVLHLYCHMHASR